MVSLLDIIGPVMVGPSSSHTAGACRIALLARALVGGTPDKALVELHGSFAKTGSGHGTDRALAGGLIGLQPDDERLRDGVELAAQTGALIEFQHVKLRGAHHPNTARLTLTRQGRTVAVTGSSLGGGRIVVTDIDGMPVEVTGEYPTLVVVAQDQPGTVAAITAALAMTGVNVATVRVSRHHKGGEAVHVYELDEPAPEPALAVLRAVPAVQMVRPLDRVN
jgi:L-serine dehydratase